MSGKSLNTRSLGAQVLLQITEGKAYADIALDQVLKEYSLTNLDRAFLTELVYGSVKYLRYLDYILSHFSTRPLEKLDPKVRSFCRIGLYQIYLMDRVPDPVAVFETVEGAKGQINRGSLGFLNGLLRSAVRGKDSVEWPTGNEYLGTIYSHPQWLVDRWVSLWGVQAAEALCMANNQIPPLTLRVNTLVTGRDELLVELEKAEIRAEAAVLSSVGVRLLEGVAIPRLRPLVEGRCQVQDVGSMLISELLQPKAGELVLDACSAPGGKTTHLAELMQDTGKIVAADVNQSRLQTVVENCRRLGISCVETVLQDAAFLHERVEWLDYFDKILVDVPCTGLGVLRRRADSRWRKSQEDLVELPRIQKAILSSAAEVLKPGGVLVYSTCSLDPAENQEVLEWFLNRRPSWILEDFRNWLALPGPFGSYILDDGETRSEYLFLYPNRENTDGFFAARLRKPC